MFVVIAKFGDDKLLGLFLKHSQWPPKAFALPGLRANAASNLPWISETLAYLLVLVLVVRA